MLTWRNGNAAVVTCSLLFTIAAVNSRSRASSTAGVGALWLVHRDAMADHAMANSARALRKGSTCQCR